jgi:hypothetical protein
MNDKEKRKEYYREYYKNNKEKMKEYYRQYYEKNKLQKKYYWENRNDVLSKIDYEKRKEYYKEWYEKNKIELNQNRKDKRQFYKFHNNTKYNNKYKKKDIENSEPKKISFVLFG